MMLEPAARAENSCKRCHKRKKRCDKTVPQCHACQHAKVACSFLEDEAQVASYPISYVRRLERKVKELEQKLASALAQSQADSAGAWDGGEETYRGEFGDDILHSENAIESSPQRPSEGASAPDFDPFPVSPGNAPVPVPRTDSLAEELRLLSLEAAAERYVGSSSGFSFAKLTQTILQRLSPDQDGFVFDGDTDNNLPNVHGHDTSNINPIFFDLHPSLPSPLPLNCFVGNMTVEEFEESMSLTLLEPSHISYILEFYFAHSHTLYPMIRKAEFEAVLWRIYADPLDPLAQSSLWQFRIWMVLAIGSTTYCSVSLMDETESVQFFNKAMTFFESAMGCGDLAGLEVLMLQVSYSFFNKIGPNTWFLVGVAARIATGMGLHTAEVYRSLAVDAAEQQKRIFFCLYMMDRVVSLALGRPFAIQDADITVEPFSDVDDENIKPDGISSTSSLEPSTMAVPLHILALRRIASDIGSHVHSAKYSQQQSPTAREETIQALHKRLLEWRRSMPFPLPDLQSKVPHLCTSWFDLNYYTHVIMLYRPSPLSPSLDPAKMKILAEASSMAIRQAINLHRQRRFAYNWLNLVAIFNSALSLMYTSTAQTNDMALVLDHGKAIDDLELAVELLEVFSTKFPSAKKIQGMIGAVSAKLRVYTMPPVGF